MMRASFFLRNHLVGVPAVLAATAIACSSGGSGPASLAILSGDGQTGIVGAALATPLVLQVKDENGKTLSGVQVTYLTTGTPHLSSTAVTTDASGDATITITLGTVPATDTVTALVDGVPNQVSWVFTSTAGPAESISIVGGNNQVARAGSQLINPLFVQASDHYGNPASGATLDWVTTAGTLTLIPPATSGANGLLANSLQLPAAPAVLTVTATLHGRALSVVFTETAD